MKSGNAKNAGSGTGHATSTEECASPVGWVMRASWNKKIRIRVLDDNLTMRLGAGGIKQRGVLYERIDKPEGRTSRQYGEFFRLFVRED